MAKIGSPGVLRKIVAAMGADGPDLWRRLDTELPLPPDGRGLFPIAANIQLIQGKILHLGGQADEDFSDLFAWAEAVGSIAEDSPLRQREDLSRIVNNDGSYRAPLHGHFCEYPVWCALWSRHENDPESSPIPDVYQWIQAHMLVSQMLLRRRDIRLADGSEPRWEAAARRIRTWHDTSFSWILRSFIGRLHSPIEFVDALEDLRDALSPKNTEIRRMSGLDSRTLGRQRNGIFALESNVEFAHRLRDPLENTGTDEQRPRGGGSSLSRTQYCIYPDHSYYRVLDGYDTTHLVWEGRAGRISVYRPDKQTQGVLRQIGVDPGEYEVARDIDLDRNYLLGNEEGDAIEDGPPLPPLSTIFAIAGSKGRHVSMQAQRLSVERRRIRVAEIRAIIDILEAVFKESSGRLRRTALLGAVALVTGSPYQSVSSMGIYRSVGRDEWLNQIGLNPMHGMWIRTPFHAPVRTPMGSEISGDQAVETMPRVVFPDVWGVAARLTEEFADLIGDPSAERLRPFRGGISSPTAYVRTWDQEITPRMAEAGVDRRWQQLDNMGDVLPSWFSGSEEGAHLENQLLFDREDALATTQAHYTAFKRQVLADYYVETMMSLGRRLGLPDRGDASDSLFSRGANLSPVPESWVGNDRAPRAEHLTVFMQAVREAQPSLEIGARVGVSQLCRHHNFRTLYLGLAMALATGFRAVRTPVTDLWAIHQGTGTMVLAEKDQWDGRHSRLVVLPRVLVSMVAEYLRHLKQFFLLVPPQVPVGLEVPATKNRDRSRYGTERFTLDLRRTLFFLRPDADGQWAPEEFTGRGLKEHCDAIQPNAWPVENAGRHFLRTYLSAKGVPATVINAQMGHWSYGEEPWTPYSAYDPVQFRETVRPALDELMAQLGFDGRLP